MEYRMYCLVLRQLNGINKGIQAAHACLEYANAFHNELDYQKYINVDKTLIMLDGGTFHDLVDIDNQLCNFGVNHAFFAEPDLGDIITAVCFIADERVWDREKYALSLEDYENQFDFHGNENEWIEYVGGDKNALLIDILRGKRLSM